MFELTKVLRSLGQAFCRPGDRLSRFLGWDHGKSYREQIVLPAPAMTVAQRAKQVLTDAPRVYWVEVQPHESQPDLAQAWVDVSMRSWAR